NEETDGLRAARSKRQIAIGMTIDEIQGLFGPPKHLVDYTFKGRSANYRIYQTDEDGSFGSFTFVDEILVEFRGRRQDTAQPSSRWSLNVSERLINISSVLGLPRAPTAVCLSTKARHSTPTSDA